MRASSTTLRKDLKFLPFVLSTAARKKGFSPKRNIVFMNVSGEEKGLLGSRYFTKNLPIEANKIHAVINVDMIGRYDTEYNPPSNYIYVIGSNFINQN